MGAGRRGVIVSLVEWASKFTCLRKVGARTAREVGEAVLECLVPVKEIVHTITADNGKEFAGHKKVSKELFTSPRRTIHGRGGSASTQTA